VFNLDSTGENLLSGSAARATIKPNEVYLYVPSKLLITVDKALRSKEIGHVFSENEFFFKNTEDRDYLVLLVFLLYEHQKGKKSFWYPYLNAIEPCQLPLEWDKRLLACLEDEELIENIQASKEEMDKDWNLIRRLLSIYTP
jgi:hypothetical protein